MFLKVQIYGGAHIKYTVISTEPNSDTNKTVTSFGGFTSNKLTISHIKHISSQNVCHGTLFHYSVSRKKQQHSLAIVTVKIPVKKGHMLCY